MFSLKGQYALVTGANRGIGKAIALALAQQGAWVAGTATTPLGAQKVSSELQALNLKGRGFCLNVSDSKSIHTLINHLKELETLPTILINNAGITRDKLALRLNFEDWKTVIDTNLTGAFELTQQCLPYMLKHRYGRIINISSIVGVCGQAGQSNYAASKAAMIGMSKSIALEVASKGITINVIAPGFIHTDMTQRITKEHQAKLLDKIPVKRWGQTKDIAYATIFLASKESSYLTGHVLHVNGGLFMN